MAVPYLDDQGRYNGTSRYFWVANEELEKKLLQNGLLWVLQDDIHDPIRPAHAYQQVACGLTNQEAYHAIDKYETKFKSYQESYEKAYSLIYQFLGPSPMSEVRHILDNKRITFRQKSQQIVHYLKDTHGILSSY